METNESKLLSNEKNTTKSATFDVEHMSIDDVLKIGREFQMSDAWRGATHDTAKLLCDTIEMLRDKVKNGGQQTMTMWEYYKDKIKHSDPLDAFYNDAMEFRESVVYTYDILNRKTPTAGTVHDWNAARTAMSMVMDDLDKAFFKFMKKKTEKNAELFDKAWMAMNKPLQMAKNAIFASNCRQHWNRNKSNYEEWKRNETVQHIQEAEEDDHQGPIRTSS